MINFSLKFPRKGLHFFPVSIILILIFVIIVDIYFTIVFNRYLNKLKQDFRENIGLNLELRYSYFDIFTGVRLNGLNIENDDNRIFYAKSIRLNLDFLNMLFKRKLVCRKIVIKGPTIYKSDYFDKHLLGFLISSIKQQKDIVESAMVSVHSLNFMDLVNLDLDGYLVSVQGKLFLTRGKVMINDTVFFNAKGTSYQNSPLEKALNYVFEATFLDSDLLISKLELTGYGATRLILAGKIKDLNDSIDLELEGEIENLLLDDIGQLNNEYFTTKGFLNANFSIKGPAENPTFKTKARFYDCRLNILNCINIKNIDSDLIWDGQALSLKLSGIQNNAPLYLNLNIDNSASPNIDSELLIQNSELFNKLNLNFEGNFIDNVLVGNINSFVGYEKGIDNKSTSLILKNIKINFDDFSFDSDSLDIELSEWHQGDLEKSLKKIEFEKLSSNIAIATDKIVFNNVKSQLYKGALNGQLIIRSKDNKISYDAWMSLNNLEINDFVKDFLLIDYQLSGILSGKFSIKSEAKESIFGDFQIDNGTIDNNAVLVSIAEFFEIPSLKTIDFSSLEINFSKVWDKYKAAIALFSKDIWIYLDNQFFVGEAMEGHLLVRLATSLMDESRRFRQLFKYIDYKEPTVHFPFKLRGYADKPRIEWLENEFKEKLQGFLSEVNKKVLQDELNKLAEEFVK